MTQQKNNRRGGGHHNGDCCSFCGATRADVEILFQGMDGANICNKCVENGHKILLDNEMTPDRKKKAAPMKRDELMKPQQIKAFLDQWVIGQDEAKRAMSVAVYNHYKRLMAQPKEGDVEIDKSNNTIGYKIRATQMAKVPYMLVIGAKEVEEGTVAVRNRAAQTETKSVDQFLSDALLEIATKKR